jgi:hypothetical protein
MRLADARQHHAASRSAEALDLPASWAATPEHVQATGEVPNT